MSYSMNKTRDYYTNTMNNADRKKYEDLQTKMMNSYTQNRNIYPQSVTDTKRMINNYVPKFVPHSSNKRKSKKQDEDYRPTKEEELLFLQQQDENWQYCGWCKKKYPAAYDHCVCIKQSKRKTRPAVSNRPREQNKEPISS